MAGGSARPDGSVVVRSSPVGCMGPTSAVVAPRFCVVRGGDRNSGCEAPSSSKATFAAGMAVESADRGSSLVARGARSRMTWLAAAGFCCCCWCVRRSEPGDRSASRGSIGAEGRRCVAYCGEGLDDPSRLSSRSSSRCWRVVSSSDAGCTGVGSSDFPKAVVWIVGIEYAVGDSSPLVAVGEDEMPGDSTRRNPCSTLACWTRWSQCAGGPLSRMCASQCAGGCPEGGCPEWSLMRGSLADSPGVCKARSSPSAPAAVDRSFAVEWGRSSTRFARRSAVRACWRVSRAHRRSASASASFICLGGFQRVIRSGSFQLLACKRETFDGYLVA